MIRMTHATLQRTLDADGPAEVVPEHMLPVQFAEILLRCEERTPELRLMSAVLQDALRAFCQYANVDGGRAARLFDETADWFGSPDVTWPFAFENICDALDLDAAWIRGLLARWQRTHAGSAPRRRGRIPHVRRIGGSRHAVCGEAAGLVRRSVGVA
jgi:hypothetical protein